MRVVKVPAAAVKKTEYAKSRKVKRDGSRVKTSRHFK